MSTTGSTVSTQRWVRVLAIALAAAPALWLAGALAIELVSDPSSPALNTAFHVVLILALLVAAAEFGTAIARTSRPVSAIALGFGGALAIAAGAIGSELFGPALLLILVLAEVVVAVRLARSAGRGASRVQADPARA